MKRRSTFQVSAVATAVLSLMTVGGVYQLHRPTRAALELDSLPSGTFDAATFLAERAATENDAGMGMLVRAIVGGHTAVELQKLSTALIHMQKNLPAQRLGVLIAEQGALTYSDMGLFIRAGSEYAYGRFVTKDYRKAALYLDRPDVISLPIAAFYMADSLLADDNPAKDRARAIVLLNFAANAGIAAAKARLSELNG